MTALVREPAPATPAVPQAPKWRSRPTLAVALSALFFVLCVARFVWPLCGPDAWRPRIDCDNPVFKFGERQSDEIVPVQFTLRNTGFRELRVTSVTPGCRCTTVGRIDTPIIPPLAATQLTARLDLKGLSGRVRKVLAVESNDPLRPRAVLVVEGTVLH